MVRILYFLIIKPLSLLPLSILYILSNFISFIFKYVVSYRSKVITANLRNSFPEKSDQELREIRNKFYDYLADVMVESIRLFSMPKEELRQRFNFTNPEVLNDVYDRGKHAILTTSHYGNWEMAACAVSMYMKHTINAPYTPLNNTWMNDKFTKSRTRHGTVITPKKQFKKWMREEFQNVDHLHALTFIADQSATYSKNVYWMNFLNQETAVMFGSELFAKEYNMPFLIAKMQLISRGHYEVELELVCENSAETPHGFITEAHTRRLEQWIHERPELWLWTHRRWKRKRKPEEVLAN